MVTGDNDSYYGSKPLKDAYEKLHDLYLTEGLAESEISELLILDIKEEQYFTARGFSNKTAIQISAVPLRSSVSSTGISKKT